MIDFHTHILPGIDDGSRNREMTRVMLTEEARQGVSVVAATPHFYAKRMSVDGFLQRRSESLEKAEMVRADADSALPELVAGAEVYYFRGIGKAEAVPRLCIGDTRTLLLEMPFAQWDEDVLRDVNDLISVQKLDIVLAHIERYVEFQKKKEIWNQVMALPLTPQLNAEGFLGGGFLRGRKIRRFCLDFLASHPDTIIGSDCHNLTDRRPNLSDAREVIAAKLRDQALEKTDSTAAKVLHL